MRTVALRLPVNYPYKLKASNKRKQPPKDSCTYFILLGMSNEIIGDFSNNYGEQIDNLFSVVVLEIIAHL